MMNISIDYSMFVTLLEKGFTVLPPKTEMKNWLAAVSNAFAIAILWKASVLCVENNQILKTFQKAAVVSSAIPCATFGKDVLQKGGNAVDAMIATMFCDGITMPQSAGIGGGFFMIIYNKKDNKFMTIDARETAPGAADENMYHGNENLSQKGGLAIAVPGQVRGLWLAYQNFGGGLPWKDLIMPSTNLCETGIPISESLATNLVRYKDEIYADEEFKQLFVNPQTGQLLQEGDKYTNHKLASTLKIIAEKGGDSFYTGALADGLVKDIQAAGGIITAEDLLNYKALIEDPFVAPLLGNSTLDNCPKKIDPGADPSVVPDDNAAFHLYSLQPPASGPVLAYILRLASDMLPASDELVTTQRLTEALKYGYATRGDLGDHNFVNSTQILDQILSDDFIKKVRSQISDTQTSNDPNHYKMTSIGPDNKGTSNIAVLSEAGDAVVSTSTINLIFGSKVISKSTGIILNNEMDDFSSPNSTNYFHLAPSKTNFIKPGKRPMSSMCPSIILDRCGDVRLLIGAAGGTLITSSVAISAARNLYLQENIGTAIEHAWFHHQLIPMKWQYYNNTPADLVEGMKKIGHDVELLPPTSIAVVSAIERFNNTIYGSSDERRPGQVDGF